MIVYQREHLYKNDVLIFNPFTQLSSSPQKIALTVPEYPMLVSIKADSISPRARTASDYPGSPLKEKE